MESKCTLIVAMLAATVLIIMSASCKNTVSGPGGNGSNLIKNPSFESGGMWSFQYWDLSDTLPDPVQMFSEDVPATGGSWSLLLQPTFAPFEGYARYYIPGESPKTAYRLTVWAKATNSWRDGSISLGLLSLGRLTPLKQTAVNTDYWQPYTLEDTVRLYPQDTLTVQLSAGSGDVVTGSVLFDEVTLEKR